MKLSLKAAAIKPSATLAVSAKAKKMRAEGLDILDFSAGEPDFDTPARISEAGIRAIREGHTRYTLTPGIVPLREAIARKFKQDYGFDVAPDQVVVSCGAKHSLYLAFLALLDPGDEVLIPAPYWVSYPPQVALADGVPKIVATAPEAHFKLTPDGLRAAITPKSRVLVLNSPSNPTGQIYSAAELAALAEVAAEADLSIVSDDIYEKLIYDEKPFASIAQVSDDARARTIVINGVSKSAAMTGWRVGYMVADAEFIKAVSRLQGQMTSNASSIAQYAALEAIAGEAVELPGWVAEFQARRDRIVGLLNDIPGVSCDMPGGAFYAFADFRALLSRAAGDRKLDNDLRWADYLLEEAHTACVPGGPFGAPGFLRFSFATSMEIIEAGMQAVKRAVNKTV